MTGWVKEWVQVTDGRSDKHYSQTTLDSAIESVVVVVKANYCKETFVKVVK